MQKLKSKILKSYKSATILLNGILLAALPVVEYARDTLPQVQEFLPPDMYKPVGVAVVVLNILLRFKTEKGLHEK